MPNFPSIIIRADASPSLGGGHVMRCLALGQILSENGFSIHFVTFEETGLLINRLEASGFEVHLVNPMNELDVIKKIKEKESISWMALDGYQFNHEFHKAIKELNLKILLFDDNKEHEAYFVDAIINQNSHATTEMYVDCDKSINLFLGAPFVLLRNEFRQNEEVDLPLNDSIKRILITLGSGDPNNVTLQILKYLVENKINDESVCEVVIGPNNPNFDSIKNYISDKNNFKLLLDVGDMCSLMKKNDICICASGSTVWELCSLGVPFINVVTFDNQINVNKYLSEMNVSIGLESRDDTFGENLIAGIKSLEKKSLRQKMVINQKKIFKNSKIDELVDCLKS
ncbi:MAG: UDP-2,4-diacetamido-2,4,6-trideoxy-beta-L-altropyranose hydrolase [Planctomycetota bacterium]|nr:MAG: UDP-2,4-diacetamido-2,4,6-trideoxy-beta-L-altropyranose hydrolase [Planctomycetota bacterium]